MKQFLLFVMLGLLVVHAVHAKCATDMYILSGVVTDAQARPIEAAIEISWHELQGTHRRSISVASDPSGQFAAKLPFYTWSSGGPQGDECSAVLSLLSVSFLAPDQEAEEELIVVSEHNMKANHTFKPTGHMKP